jgi:hypothetical protein
MRLGINSKKTYQTSRLKKDEDSFILDLQQNHYNASGIAVKEKIQPVVSLNLKYTTNCAPSPS